VTIIHKTCAGIVIFISKSGRALQLNDKCDRSHLIDINDKCVRSHLIDIIPLVYWADYHHGWR